MTELDERSWAKAIGMYEMRATVAKVTGREHENWLLDVVTLMHGETRDVRGWRTVDKWEGELDRIDEPSYPFAIPPEALATPDAWKPYLHEIPRSQALRFLVALSTPWIDVTMEPDFEERRMALEADARVILSRFPEGSHFYANTGQDSATRDYYQRVSGWFPFSTRTYDFGLVLVSQAEVGMVWSFR
ncbi:hypothetical protein [Streptomyces antibioticus]|uniref:Uncharacterized protein n=1 Tax=Streptomyces antibioticus TaxID=1890 RepID=A0AAE6YBV1_STRAT|nr:hypothetical protein [Streptomyces antibioticus]MCX5171882.1 hypothetical protein [Streptomyces antibioticus]OOQ48886.1 hypothetical protein AFM16_28005 [Streptomyces antibioticus]QIT46983.1 hypothetical protein HCX60_28510 [Streptomyces antibioticus]